MKYGKVLCNSWGKAFVLSGLCVFMCACQVAGKPFIVKNGEPCAEIVIAEKASRSTRLAAQELQTGIEKISGARLPITTQPGANVPVQVYVGRSPGTDRLQITTDGLRYGAYRIVSGKNWMALIGDDTEFRPIEPWAAFHAEVVEGKAQREWDRMTGALWGLPNLLIYKHRFGMPGDTGLPDAERHSGRKLPPLEMWLFDERGSFNAVCGFLMNLGARWYMPGELGEVLPRMKSIPLPRIDETVRPDFPMRRVNILGGRDGMDVALWGMRLGLCHPYAYGVEIAHGMSHMTRRDENLAAHPDWFALYGGKRDNRPGQSKNQLCYSNEELFRETVRYVRAQFDHYKLDVVSVNPPDGYTAICQCKLCEGKEARGTDNRGRLSDYVWSFVNRVAKEVGQTHPDRKVLNLAYGSYSLPPPSIAKLEPNVLVCIVGGRRPVSNKPEQQAEARKLRESWMAKTDTPILIFENYPLTIRGWYLPSYTPHSLGESVNATKGLSLGEDIQLNMWDSRNIGFNHFPVYFTARMWWGGPKADVDAMFREYCRLFYGPAGREMHAFFTTCEAHWQEMEKDKSKTDTALALFAAAQAKADPNSVYGKRLALISDYLEGLRSKRVQLAQKRGPVPKLRLGNETRSRIVVDGKLNDEAWTNCPVSAAGTFRELQTGRQPVFGTTVKAAWIDNNLYFAIRCDEHPGEKVNIATTNHGDQAIWLGDTVEILLETESHSYYQIVVNPAGAIINVDQGAASQSRFAWDSQAEVAVQMADDHWTVEIRIPVTRDQNDPLHNVIGRKPTRNLPWHINLCRQRVRDNGTEHSALSPTSAGGFHRPMKFAYFYEGLSHEFQADPTVSDYIIDARKAARVAGDHTNKEVLAAYVALADREGNTDFQKSDALEQAAQHARSLQDHDRADELADRIPIEAVARTARMENLLARRKADEVIAQFGAEDLAAWPFWQIGAGAFARGRAYLFAKEGANAEADLQLALAYTPDPRIRINILTRIGNNREINLQDDEGALNAYRRNFESQERIGGADQFRSVQCAMRILTRRGEFEEALAVFNHVDIEHQSGFWRNEMLLSLGDAMVGAGRKDEALKAYREILADENIDERHRDTAAKAVKTLETEDENH